GHRRRHRDETGHIAARAWNARHETAANRICNLNKHDRDGARLLQQCRGRGCVCRKIRSSASVEVVIEADPKVFELDASRHSVADQTSQLAKTRTINAT